ncbi:hypothetical protein HD553DRAFT_193165 [Filobasidium floriforme]|uniref:uncharacterized protein n=1 Tax=Filobasidium floriforme TaxID=5210 RepID=UPI001E8CEE17|nr:uncharacterized protein HD553DRAFT_193165 [Filobasidium floriforme]KAH8087266.1 hypothetical protein HD553DRAFT_193165 [Filobasidium floriforme]
MEEAPTKRALQDECQNCKSVKIPCSQKGAQLTTDEAAASCKRCARLGLPCRFAPKKTGRPRQYPARTKTTKTIKPTPTSSTTTAQVDNSSAHDHVGKKRSSDETENEGSTSKRPVPASHNQSIGLDPDIFGLTGELETIPEPFRDWQGSLQAPFTSFDED